MNKLKKPLVLMVLDGWGISETQHHNAIAQARTPNMDMLMARYPHAKLDASGHAVGLPAGVMGNSEVGHLNIGAGRIALVGLTRIYQAIEDGSFYKNPALLGAIQAAKQHGSTLHLMGLVSDGAVHSHQDHLYSLLQFAKQNGLADVAIHAFTDGRDTSPQSGVEYITQLEEKIREIGVGFIASITGRFYAMDRDKRWDRTEAAYNALVLGEGRRYSDSLQALQDSYAKGETDEFISPTVITGTEGKPKAVISDRDAVVFFNFRADRARQLSHALTQNNFTGFQRKNPPHLSAFVCMAEYDAKLKLPVAFPPVHLKNTLGEIIAARGLSQLRIAETEKYAHVTFFFNGGDETIFSGEERVLIPSPRDVPTYDLKPEMSAPQLGAEVIKQIERDHFDLIVLNFANADMVGHTGNLVAAIKAVETVDEQIGKIYRVVHDRGGTILITADHGNCEQMADAHGKPHTAHTTDLVPFLLVGEAFRGATMRPEGTLADIAPTILQILGIPQPAEMSGKSLLLSR